MTKGKSVQGDRGDVIPKCHSELVSESFKRAVFTFNPKNSGPDY